MRTRTKPTAKQFTKAALADALGISRQALNVHLKAPDAPPVGDIDAWQVFIAAHGRIGTSPEDLRRTIALKRIAILEETRIRQARENSVEAGKLILLSDAIQQANAAGATFMSQLERAKREWPPLLEGLSAQLIAEKLYVEIERIRTETDSKLKAIGT